MGLVVLGLGRVVVGSTAPDARLGTEVRMGDLVDRMHFSLGEVRKMATESGLLHSPPRLEEFRTCKSNI